MTPKVALQMVKHSIMVPQAHSRSTMLHETFNPITVVHILGRNSGWTLSTILHIVFNRQSIETVALLRSRLRTNLLCQQS